MTAADSTVPAQPGRLRVEDLTRSRWGRLLLPSLSDLFFISLVCWLFIAGGGWQGLLMDADTGWHIRTGEWILANGAVPHKDLFSFSKPAADWYAWEWLSDVAFARLHAIFGLKGVVLLCGLALCASALLALRHMLSRGANVLVALVLTGLYLSASTIHYHARPHVFTLLLLPGGYWLLDRDLIRPGPAVWALPFLVALWTNLHGGFLAMIAVTGLAAAGCTAEQFFGPRDWARARRYWLLFALCAAASIVNPYGLGLHKHIFEFLRSDWILNQVGEFKSPSFRGSQMLNYEIGLLAGLLAAGLLIARRQFTGALLILYFAHASLTSVRHAPVFLLIASPWIASEWTAWWNRVSEAFSRKSLGGILRDFLRDLHPGFARGSVWSAAFAISLWAVGDAAGWPRDFHPDLFPKQMIESRSERLITERLFTKDQWADYLIYRYYPRVRVFCDGRSDFYGKEIGRDYLEITNAGPRWRPLLDRHRLSLVLAPVEWPLTGVLREAEGWRILSEDRQAVLFERVNGWSQSAGAAKINF